jgi:type I restriction enzyme S subunit
VPQDPNDEPASVLLERIRAERATAPVRAKAAKGAPR